MSPSVSADLMLRGVSPDVSSEVAKPVHCRVRMRAKPDGHSLPDGFGDAVALGVHPAELVADLVPARHHEQRVCQAGRQHSDQPGHVCLFLVMPAGFSSSKQKAFCLLFSLGSLHRGGDVPQGLLVDAGELPVAEQALLICHAMQATAAQLCQFAAVAPPYKDLLVHVDVHELVQQPARHLRKGRGKLHVPA
jgi:hypothetical protein